ncbi:mitochondrial outer membrane protein porin 6 isoform X8 [Elaeis guineensis]|uniref:mitochondrial outer membrane protein porin 6 isoform X8 n=1 Tax=Elaeis guineensis var. tenera TaxID=51953 RepID=UPI003C6D1C9C
MRYVLNTVHAFIYLASNDDIECKSFRTDLLTKDYNFDHKFTLTTPSDAGLGLTAMGVKKDQLFIGDISTQYRSGKTTVDVKVDTDYNVSTTITVNELVAGVRTSFSFRIPDQKSGKLDLQYLYDRAAINSSIVLTPIPLLELAAAIGSKELTLGTEVGFDSASASFTEYNSGIGFNKHDFSAALILFCKAHTGGVRDEHDGRTHILPRTPNQTNEGRNLHHPNQVHKRITQKIWNRELQSDWHTHEPNMQA